MHDMITTKGMRDEERCIEYMHAPSALSMDRSDGTAERDGDTRMDTMIVSNRSVRKLILVTDGSTRHGGVRVVQWYKVTDETGSEMLSRFGISCCRSDDDGMSRRKRYYMNAVTEGSGERPYSICARISDDADVGLNLILYDRGNMK